MCLSRLLPVLPLPIATSTAAQASNKVSKPNLNKQQQINTYMQTHTHIHTYILAYVHTYALIKIHFQPPMATAKEIATTSSAARPLPISKTERLQFSLAKTTNSKRAWRGQRKRSKAEITLTSPSASVSPSSKTVRARMRMRVHSWEFFWVCV